MAWTDYIPDWSSVDKLRLAAPLSGAQPLINAINERCSVVNIAPLDDIRLEKFNIDRFRSIQNKVTELIPLFVNHLDNSGNWSNTEKGEIAPKWNEADILAAIDDSERIPVPVQLLELSAEWLYQQYKILNLLVWITRSVSLIDRSGMLGTSVCAVYPTSPIAGDIDNAIANATPRDDWNIGAYTARSSYAPFVAWAVNGKCKFNSSALLNFDSSCDFYAFMAIGGDTANPTHHTYDDGGRGYLPYKWNLLENQNISKNNEFTSDEYGVPSTEFPKYPPDMGLANTSKGWMLSGTTLISKFNVPGGFEYAD